MQFDHHLRSCFELNPHSPHSVRKVLVLFPRVERDRFKFELLIASVKSKEQLQSGTFSVALVEVYNFKLASSDKNVDRRSQRLPYSAAHSSRAKRHRLKTVEMLKGKNGRLSSARHHERRYMTAAQIIWTFTTCLWSILNSQMSVMVMLPYKGTRRSAKQKTAHCLFYKAKRL
jgi:hypothetical protein